MKKRLIVSGILLGFMVLFLCLKAVWLGFVYFATSALCLLSFFWTAELINIYLDDYVRSFEQDFAVYKAQILNSTNLTEAEFELNIKIYKKKFKNTLVRDKLIDIFKILFCFSLAITCIVVMCQGLIR